MPPSHLTTIQILAALVSFISSFLMANSIAWFGSEEGSTPYRRIILGMSISDILQSLSLLMGPLSVPLSKKSIEADNEALSCQSGGFILHVGTVAVMLYTVFLCVYYLCKLKYRMSDDAFKHKVERKFHAFIAIFSLSSGIFLLVMDAFHTNSLFKSFCNISYVPTGCRIEPDIVGECDATHEKRLEMIISIFIVGLFAACVTGITVSMGLLYHHTYVLNQNVQREVSVPTALRGPKRDSRENKSKQGEGEEDTPDSDQDQDKQEDTPQDRVLRLSRLYRREMLIQATFYVGAFCLMYIPVMMAFIDSNPSDFLLVITVLFYPLGGFLNILVYTRPKIAGLRRDYPACSWLRGFWLVLMEGGEIPDDVDLSLPCYQSCCHGSIWLDSEYEFTTTADSTGAGGQQRRNSLGMNISRLGF